MRSTRLFALSLLAAFAFSAPVLAQDKKKKDDGDKPKDSAGADKGGPRKDPKGITGISPFWEKLNKGQKLTVARDFPGALAAFQEAVTEDTKNPWGHYYLGAVQILKGDLAEADASWQMALRNAGPDEVVKAKILFGIADLRERQKKLDDAKAAWSEYGKFVADHPKSKGYPATVGERQKVIDTHNDLEKKYGEVKARIAAREKELKAQREKDAQKDADANDKKPRKLARGDERVAARPVTASKTKRPARWSGPLAFQDPEGANCSQFSNTK